ncbi:uncharacterized protein LOC122137936 isoform X2 [Cyprinus carpio]|uniref:Uncharacterized protein LOC122137936 isoform X2 n=1 Tax=Cyprinus carpio TaxID=7962 RepID=A0A9Q9WGV9_CYPCA|nr:uncharacterized protein LOC122137936 isoform X2 [Cyprinus carpio]
MDSTTLLSVVGGALLLSIILVTSLCTYCWGHRQPTSIHQRSSDSEYPPTSGFVVRHPVSTYAPHMDHTRIVPYQHSNSLGSPSITVTKVHSCPPSETGSQASYVNQNESGDERSNRPQSEYITVLPDPPITQSQGPSRASSLSSGECYINVEKDENVSEEDQCDNQTCVDESDSDMHDYENFCNSSGLRKKTYSLSRGSQSSDERESSDYVNTGPSLQ